MGVYINFLKSVFESRFWKVIIKIFKIFVFGRKRKGFVIYSFGNGIDLLGIEV